MKRERLGLLLIAAALAVIVLVAGALIHTDRSGRLEEIRSHGVSLVRMLGRMPYESLQAGGPQNPLRLVQHIQGRREFAYAVLADVSGRTLVEVTAPDAIVPRATPPAEPASWIGERLVEHEGPGPPFREFHGPILSGSERVAHLRLGFREPQLGAFARAPFVAGLALPIFLLAPLAYFLLQREIRPLRRAATQLIEADSASASSSFQIEATGELADFISAFNRFMQGRDERARALDAEHAELLTSSRVLSYEKSQLKAILESLPFATFVMDEAGVVSFASTRLDALLGTDAKEVVGKTPDQWWDHRGALAFLSRYYGVSRRGRRADSVEIPVGDHAERTVCLSAHPLAADGASFSASTLVVVRDATAEAVARRSQAEFITHVAHELKSPLNVFGMYTELLLGEDGASEETRLEACNTMRDEVERLAGLVNTLLSIARLEMGSVSLTRQRVRLGDFLEDVVTNLGRSRREDVEIELETPRQLPAIFIDKELFRVALNNLMTNAIKYNKPGGTVTLTAEERSEEIVISVRDTGIGIAEEDLARLFDKFFRSDSEEVQNRPGHGLGLSLAKEVVDVHGGRMRVQSVPGEGSEFSITFKKNAVLTGESE